MAEENKLINLELHPKEYQLIQFFRKQFKYGTVELTIHSGLPQGYTIRTIEGKFDGNINAIDNKN